MQTISKYVIAFLMLLSSNYIEELTSKEKEQAAIPVESIKIKKTWKCPSGISSDTYNYS